MHYRIVRADIRTLLEADLVSLMLEGYVVIRGVEYCPRVGDYAAIVTR